MAKHYPEHILKRSKYPTNFRGLFTRKTMQFFVRAMSRARIGSRLVMIKLPDRIMVTEERKHGHQFLDSRAYTEYRLLKSDRKNETIERNK